MRFLHMLLQLCLHPSRGDMRVTETLTRVQERLSLRFYGDLLNTTPESPQFAFRNLLLTSEEQGRAKEEEGDLDLGEGSVYIPEFPIQ